MNLKKIAGMCKSAGQFVVLNVTDEDGEVLNQWVNIGAAMYCVNDLGLTAKAIARMAGVKESKTDEYLIEDQTSIEANWMRDYPRVVPDVEAVKAIAGLLLNDREIRFYRRGDQTGTLLPINSEYLAPVDTDCKYYIRIVDGERPVLAIKEGMYIAAIINPYDVFGVEDGIKLPELKRAFEAEENIWR